MDEVKVNIIGLGIMGKKVAQSLLRNSKVRVTAVADLKEENLQTAQAELNIKKTYQLY